MNPLRVTAAMLLVALLVGLFSANWQAQRNGASVKERLDEIITRDLRQLDARMRSYEHGLRGTRALVLALGFDGVTPAQFERYLRSRDLDREFPGLRGLGLVRRVPAASQEDFAQRMRSEGRPEFRVRQLHPHVGERYVIQYIGPLQDNRAALGLDIASDPARRQAAQDAQRLGMARMTAPITLLQAVGRSATLLLLPIYGDGGVPADPAEREVQGMGWAYAPLVADEVLNELALGDDGLGVELLDRDAQRVLYRGGTDIQQPTQQVMRELPIFGRHWELSLRADERYASGLGFPEPVLVGGVSGLLTLLGLALLAQLGQARERNRALNVERVRRAAVVEVSNDAHLLLDAQGLIQDWNPGAERLFGRPAARVLGEEAAALLCGSDVEAGRTLLSRLAGEGRLAPMDHVCQHADGRSLDLSLVGAALRGRDGRLTGYALTLRDIGPAKQLERQMRELNSRLEQEVRERTLLLDRVGEMALVGGWQYEVATQRIGWTAQTYRIHGVPADYQPTLDQALDFYAAESRPLIRAAVKAALEQGRAWDLELRFLPRDRGPIWVRAVGQAVFEQGVMVRLQGAFQDITAAKEAERELRRTGSLLRLVLDSASEVSIIATDPQLCIQVFNRGAERLLGYRAEELVGRHTPMLIHDPIEVETRARELALESGRPIEGGEVFIAPERLRRAYPWRYVGKDGRRLPVSLVVTAMQGDDGELLGYLGVAQDISLQQRREQALQEASEKADEANHAKSQFLANMSHEIRTPMNAVLGLAYLLAQTELDAEQARFVARIRDASQGLLAVLNDVLDLSKIEAGELILENIPFDPAALLDSVRELLAAQAESKGLGLRLDLQPPLPVAVGGDPTRLRQVLTNLAANAVKFTAQGGVALRLAAQQRQPGRWHLRFEVEDSGIGISEAALAGLFRPFAQADASTTRRFGGSGLGLALARQLAEAMGGRIEVHSQLGLGSRFGLALELAEAAALPDAAPPAVQGLHGLRVLVADDSEINVEVVRRVLELHGAAVRSVDDGEAAVQAVAEGGLDAVLLDLQMPVLDGIEAARRIRALPGAQRIPLIALTAAALVSEQELARDAGMDAFLTKPFHPAELVACLNRLCPRAAAPVIRLGPANGWPEALPGIELADARSGLAGDFPLWQRLLHQLLQQTLPTDRAGHHRLAGAAGALGARRLQSLALQAERQLSAAPELEEGLRTALQAAWEQLQHTGAGLSGGAAPVAAGPAAAAPLEQLPQLLGLLQAQDLAALVLADALDAGLSQHLGQEAHARWRQALEALRFADAAALLAAAGPGTTVIEASSQRHGD